MDRAFSKSVLIIFLVVLLTFQCVASRPTEEDYCLEKDYLQQYGNGYLFCGNIAIAACSFGDIGCRIRLSTDVTKNFLHQTFTCINEDKMEGLKVARRVELPRARRINIDLDIYINTESSYNVGYGLGGDEFANGVIALDQWEEMKKKFRQAKKRAHDKNP